MTHKYIVKHPFKYGRKQYKPGQEFIPMGGRFDEKIMDTHCTQVREVNA